MEHIHSFKDTVIPSTCKERGYTLHKCDCGYEHKDSFQPLSGHNFKLIEGTEPDCTNGGNQKVVCSDCGKEVNSTLPPLGHKFGAWNVVELPGCTIDGVQERYCGVCGAKEMQAIPATGHKLTKPVKSQTKKGYIESYCENCGETFEKKPKAKKIIITVIILLLVAVAGVFASIKFVIPYYHYSTAKKLLEEGNYAAAYSHFYKCMDYKDSKRFMYNFCFADEEWSYQRYKYGDDVTTGKNQYVYNENGYVIKQTYYGNYGEKTIYQNEWGFYENGKPKSLSRYQDGKLVEKEEYNSQGDSTLWCWYYSDEVYTLITSEYKYYDNGEIRERIDYDEDGKEQSRYTYEYEYDDNGNLLTKTAEGTYNYNEEYTKTKYEYDVNGILLKYTEYDKNGKETGKYTYKIEFTENGYEYTYTCYDEDGNKVYKDSYVYTNPVSYRKD